MKILLVGIYDNKTVSLAPQLLSAYVRQFVPADIELQTLEFSIFSDSVETIAASVRRANPDVVGFSCYIWNYNLIKQITPYLDCTIVVGGPQVTGIEKQLLQSNPEIDIIATGEGEQIFLELLQYFEGQRALSEIAGITTLNMQNPPLEPVGLETIPPLYEEIFSRNPDISWVSFETSRGCPMGCGYCTWGYSRKMRYYPLDHVLSELDVVLQNPRIREIYLCDSSLLLNKSRAKAILDHIIRSGSNQTIRYEFSPEQLDDEIIQRMIQLPSNEFNFGIQTTNPDALALIGRAFDQNGFERNYRKFVDAFPTAQITIDLIYGLPGDNIEGYLTSMNYAMSLPGVSRILTNPLLVLPGSRFFQERSLHGIVLEEGDSFLLKENGTFSLSQMHDARRHSFYVNLLYLNTALKDALLRLSTDTNTKPTDRMKEFFDSVEFDLIDGEYPLTIPSIKKDFEYRNYVMVGAMKKFTEIVESFKQYSEHQYDSMLVSFFQCFTGQYYKYSSYIKNKE